MTASTKPQSGLEILESRPLLSATSILSEAQPVALPPVSTIAVEPRPSWVAVHQLSSASDVLVEEIAAVQRQVTRLHLVGANLLGLGVTVSASDAFTGEAVDLLQEHYGPVFNADELLAVQIQASGVELLRVEVRADRATADQPAEFTLRRPARTPATYIDIADNPDAAAPGSIPVDGTPLSATRPDLTAFDTDVYRFTSTADDQRLTLAARTEAATTRSDQLLIQVRPLADASPFPLREFHVGFPGQGADEVAESFRLEAAGEYTVTVSPVLGRGQPYDLALELDEPPSAPPALVGDADFSDAAIGRVADNSDSFSRDGFTFRSSTGGGALEGLVVDRNASGRIGLHPGEYDRSLHIARDDGSAFRLRGLTFAQRWADRVDVDVVVTAVDGERTTIRLGEIDADGERDISSHLSDTPDTVSAEVRFNGAFALLTGLAVGGSGTTSPTPPRPSPRSAP